MDETSGIGTLIVDRSPEMRANLRTMLGQCGTGAVEVDREPGLEQEARRSGTCLDRRWRAARFCRTIHTGDDYSKIMQIARLLLRLFLPLFLGLIATGTGARESRQANPALPVVAAAELPAEARDTLALIKRGGPFPYRKDGVVFQNRERRLPAQPSGHYREYTVPTPGARDRGARRIVASSTGEFYYTGDHYRSFRRIRE